IILQAENFGLLEGLAKLSEAINGTPIVAAASFTFDLQFETGDTIPALEAARVEATQRRTAVENAPIAREGCETRFTVISAARAIYFRTGSAEIDKASGPLLDSIADIAKRCGALRIEVTGHTDSVGAARANQQLSEQRARSVAAYLTEHGIASGRIE